MRIYASKVKHKLPKLLVVGLITCIIFVGFYLYGKISQNLLTGDLTQFSSPTSDYRVFYMSGSTLYSNSPDAKDKHVVVSLDNESMLDYFLLRADKTIMIAGETGIYMVNQSHVEQKTLDFPPGYKFVNWQFSSDKKLLTVLLNKEISDNGKWSVEQLGYYIEIPTSMVVKIFDNSETHQKSQLKYMLWHSDNRRIFLIETHTYNPNDVKEEYFDYDTSFGIKRFVGSQDALTKPNKETTYAQEDIWDIQIPHSLSDFAASSQDGREAEIDEGYLTISGQRVLPICRYNESYNHNECSNPQWSPDDQRIYVEGFGNDDIHVVEVNTRKYSRYDSGHNVKLVVMTFVR